MNVISRFYVVIGLLFLLSGCIEQQTGSKHTFFIQAPLDHPVIKTIQEELKPIINTLIEQELGKKLDKGFPVFFFKRRQAVTVYYVNDLYDNNQPLRALLYLFLEPCLDRLNDLSKPGHVSLSTQLHFWGEDKKVFFDALDLVLMINDPREELSLLNKKVKQSVHYFNKEYKRACNRDLYDIAKSERFSYVPHLSLGHLRVNYLKFLINDASKAEAIVERIKQKIIKIISENLARIDEADRKLNIEKLAIYDLKKRCYIKERVLALTSELLN